MNTAHWTTSRLLSTAARLNDHDESERLTDLNVTHAAATTLRALSDSGPISQGRLAVLVHVQAQTMGRILEKLEVKGLVSRARNTIDARSIRTRITTRGQTVVRNIDQIRASTAGAAGLSDPVFREQLIAIIRRLGSNPAFAASDHAPPAPLPATLRTNGLA
ncbi:MarR family transcriptional regulator [Arthrobacter agilis]|uniref:MarR family winged helix-turn-helix transcriptional regulator n=1 Tax=Arthrobacter agilis TaxID=37921 RepID=UPI002365BF2B|nr:MarR family transcriptional regulator [Arthrobacter agilis]WDF33211.1 MarR family transcriptional regulator [Arthrobacter agilis]